MNFSLQRVILFTKNVEACAAFYRDTFGLTELPSEYERTEWIELEGGGCKLAFHKARGKDSGAGPHKLVFFAEDVTAARNELTARGIALGPVKTFGTLSLCDGRDPDGNAFQLSNRP
jgi:catechol 2,3-dioxygenase-like lactoylglutathione lyase family enzyme